MACLTELSREEAERLARAYGLKLLAVRPMEQGSVNSNFRLETDRGVFFGRIYEEQGDAGALSEMRLTRQLAELGVPTPAPLVPPSVAEPLYAAGKPFSLYPWVQGEILCLGRLRAAHLEQVGQALASLHLASAQVHVPAGRFEPLDIEARLRGIIETPGIADTLAQAAREIGQALQHCVAARRGDLPRGLIHGDLFRDNALWSGDRLAAVIDFESASDGCFVYDLMVCVHAWCFSDHFEPDKVQALLGGYQARRPLSPQELDSLANEGALAALRFATTRITDFSMRTPAGEAPKRDYRRFLQRLRQLQDGALQSLGSGPVC